MLTDKEKSDCKDLLSCLSIGDVYCLVATITSNMVQPCDVQEAINCILQHTVSVESLLMRKKVSRDMLFKYLHSKKVDVDPTLDKKALVSKVIDFWGGNCTVRLYRNTSQSIDADELAVKFSEWFYGLLNSSVSGELQTGLGAEHFWPNCNLALKLESPEGNLEQSVRENSDEAVHLLCTTCVGHRLLFNPNLTRDGVKGRMDSHGLVTVIACGTLHVGGMCVGVFEQSFGLIRDPSAHNNWKIKTTELQMKAMSVTSLPTVQAGTLNSELSLTKF